MALPEESDRERDFRLVRKAIIEGGLYGLAWSSRGRAAAERCPEFEGFNLEALRKAAVDYLKQGGTISQRDEDDEKFRRMNDSDFYYSICFPVDFLDEEVYMKIVLSEIDEDDPGALIVGVHPTSR